MQATLGFSAGRLHSFRSHRKPVVSAAFVEAPEMERRSNSRRGERSLYEVLRVDNNASLKEIKAAYRTLAKLYHPDVTAASAAAAAAMAGKEFIEIHEAYAKLSDPDARAEYDARLRRTMMMSFQGSGDCVWAESEFYSGRRWETDQCW